jgi:protein gp37
VTKIEWTDRTWNPWWAYKKVVPECDHCYAAVFAGHGLHATHHGVAERGEWSGSITRSSPSVRKAPLEWPGGSLVLPFVSRRTRLTSPNGARS